MAQLAAVRVTLGRVVFAGALGTSFSVLVTACGDEAPAPTTAQRVAAFLRDCGVLSLGRYEGHPELADDACAFACYTSQACLDAREDVCAGQPAAAYLSCLADCAPKCTDGVTPMTRCNGVSECGDASDEVGCAPFTCVNGATVLMTQRCDGAADCPDGSDETSCPAKDDLPCASGASVVGVRCDGIAQCPDGSDEAVGCATPMCSAAVPSATGSTTASPGAAASVARPLPPGGR